MKRLVMLLATAVSVGLLAACGGGEVVVQAQLPGESPDAPPVALRDLTIRLLPYDRDAIFDSLQAAYPEPEPEIPATLLALQDSVSAAQEEWRRAESRWNEVRDRMRQITEEMQGLNRAERRYRELWTEFGDLERQETESKRRMDSAFAQFDALQKRLLEESQTVRLQREAWADEAFASIDEVIAAKLKAAGREELADTTDASGVGRFIAKPGKWWVTARYDLPYQELYWNIPVEVKRGEPAQVTLTRENAIIRPRL